jgi:4-aminobutyrate aminotransferase
MKPNDLESFKTEGDLNLSNARVSWAKEHIDSDTQALLAEDAKYFLHQSLSSPCLNVLTGCDGTYLEDTQGRRILDFHGNNVHQVGFGNPDVIEAISNQLQTLSFCTRRYTNRPAIDLAKKLVSLAPGDENRLLFAPSGTAAIGMALKLARAATGRHKTISMWDSFHGASLDAISIGGEAIFRQNAGPLLSGCEHAPPPDPSQCPFECEKVCNLKCANYIEYMLEKEGDVAAVVAETVRSTPFIPPKNYWKQVREACDRHGALLILDEIPHCLGRTGKMFTCEHYDVEPDVLVIGKGLGGGIFPLAAVVARAELNVASDRALGHYTHEKSPVACSAALATIKYLEEHEILNRVTHLGHYFESRISEFAKTHAIVQEFRGLGLLMGIQVCTESGERDKNNAIAEEIMYRCLTKGLNFKLTTGNTLTLTPPLTISDSEVEAALEILESSLEEAELNSFKA